MGRAEDWTMRLSLSAALLSQVDATAIRPGAVSEKRWRHRGGPAIRVGGGRRGDFRHGVERRADVAAEAAPRAGGRAADRGAGDAGLCGPGGHLYGADRGAGRDGVLL